MQLDQLYQQVVLSHATSHKNRRKLENPTIVLRGVNPSCGDDLELQLIINNQGILDDIAYQGQGCALSQASVSILSDVVRGKSLEEVHQLIAQFFTMIREGKVSPQGLETLQEATIFSTIATMPARVKCVVLGWRTLEQALSGVKEYKEHDESK